MANERIIRIGTEFDISNVLSGINKIRQDLGNIGVDSSLFKDINKDLDNLSKRALSIGAALKNGIPEKGVNSFLNQINEVNKIYTSLPEKIRQVNATTNNIKLSDNVATRLEEIDKEIEEISADIKKTLGSDLKEALKNALPQGEGFINIAKNISEADDKTEKFEDELKKLKDKADSTKKSLTSMFTSYSNAQPGKTDTSKIKARNLNELGTLGLNALNSDTLSNVQQELARQAGETWKTSTTEATKLNNIVTEYINTLEKVTQLETSRAGVQNAITTAQDKAAEGMERIGQLTEESTKTFTQEISENNNKIQATASSMEQIGEVGKETYNEIGNSVSTANNYMQKQDSILKQIATRATSLIGIGAAFNYITRAVREAWSGIRELDSEFNQIAVVTDKTTSQLWQSFSTYSQMAQALGVTTKDAVATSALYYQQGLDTAEVMTLTAETIRMAQIAGMDFATATNQMTAALRGFNLEMDQASTVNDIFSTLAASAAVSTEELAYALTKTASIAESAGMSIDTTSAFLTKMIETTREAPENIGTAMKSIVARFEELKSNPLALTVEVEGEEVVANKVEKAIALAGVALRDATTGQFRDLDDVFLELAKAWDGLDRNTQRYIATIAAGSRQQSRFIALMDGYDRTLELVELAQDSEGQSAAQFLKTLDSLDSKLNQIGNSLESLYQKFVNSDFFGGLLDSLNDFLQGLGKLDAGQLAIYGTVGLVIGNTIINSIKQVFDKNTINLGGILSNAISSPFVKGFSKSEDISNITENLVNKGYKKNNKSILTKAFENINNKKDKSNQLSPEQIQEQVTDFQRLSELTVKIDNSEAKKSLDELDVKLKFLREDFDNNQKEIIETIDERAKLLNDNPELNNALIESTSLREKIGADLDEIPEAVQDVTQKNNEILKQSMSAVGPALITSLSTGISMALTSEDPWAPLYSSLTGVVTFAISLMPTLIAAMKAAGWTSGKSFGEAFVAAGGPPLLAIMAVLGLIIATVGLVKQQLDKQKTSLQELTEEYNKLEEKQKQLDSSSEKANAEAATQKVSYKNLNKNIKAYDELINRVGRTTEENDKLNNVIADLAENFPDLVEYYDEAGNAVLKQREEWEAIVQLQKEATAKALMQATTAQLIANQNQIQLAQTSKDIESETARTNLQEQYRITDADVLTRILLGTPRNTIGEKYASTLDGFITAYFSEREKELKMATSPGRSSNYLEAKFIDNIIQDLTDTTLSDSEAKFKTDKNKFDFLTDLEKTVQKGLKEENSEAFNELIDEYFDANVALKEGFLGTIQQLEDDFNTLENEKNDPEAQKEITAASNRAKEQLKQSIINYIETIAMPEEIEGYSNENKKIFAELAADKIEPVQGVSSLELIKKVFNLTENGYNELLDLGVKRSTLGNIKETFTSALNAPALDLQAFTDDSELYSQIEEDSAALEALEKLREEYLNSFIKKTNQETIDMMANLKEQLSDEDFDFLQVDLEKTNLNDFETFIVNKIPDEFQGYFLEKIREIREKISAELTPQFTAIAEQFGYDFGKKLQDLNIGDSGANAILKTFSGLEDSKVPNIISTILNINDWGNIEQLKKLGEAYLIAGRDAEDATESVKILYEQFTNPFNINLDEDYLKSRFSDLATQLQDVAKNFKDLNSAIKEYNENGKLSAQTILDIVAAGNIQYLTFDKVTNSVQLNTKAIEDNWKEQTRAAVEAIDLEIARAVAAETALKLQRDIEQKKLNILKEAGSRRGRLSEKQYEELQKLENINAINTINGQLSLENTQISQEAEFFKELLGNRESYYEELAKQANDWGQTVWANFEAGMKQMSLQERVSNTVDTKAFATTWNSSDLNTKSLEAQKRYLQAGPEKIAYQFDEETLNAYIEAEEKRINLLNETIDAYKNGRVTLENYRNILNTIPETSLSDYFSDTAKSTEKANEELKEYLSTLERFYNLTREIDEADRKKSKAKAAFEKNPTPENAEVYQQTIVASAQLGREQYASGKQQQQVDRDYYSKEIIKELTKLGYSPEQIQKLLAKWNLAPGQEGYVDQKAVKEFLNSSYIQSLNSEDEIKIIQELNETIQDAENDIDSDVKMMYEGEDRVESAKEEQEEYIEKLTEISKKLDPLIAIKAGIEASNKLLDKANEQSEDYYNSGGKEGLSAAEYGHALGSKIDYNDSTIKQLQDRRETLKTNNSELFNKYLQDLGNGIITFKADNIDDLIGDPKLLEKVETLKEDFEKLYETEEELKKQNKELSKTFKNLLKENRQKYSDMVNRVAQALAELDQRQIDEVKKKYAMIQEEDDKYLEKLQKSIDKQRQLRDQAKSYDDLEEQEKRLALLERDTSGANAAEIASLKEQIKDARQSLVDMEQDNIVNNIADDNQRRKEAMDEETTFLQNVMDERTYDMQYYIDQAYDIVNAAIDGDEGAYQRMIEVLKKTDEEFFRNTKEAQEKWFEDLEADWTHAKDHVEAVNSGLSTILGQTDSQVHETLKTFSNEDVIYIGSVSQAIDELKGKTDFIDVKSFDDTIEKANLATIAIQEIITKLDEIPKDVYTEVHIKWTEEGKPSDTSNVGTSTSATTDTNIDKTEELKYFVMNSQGTGHGQSYDTKYQAENAKSTQLSTTPSNVASNLNSKVFSMESSKAEKFEQKYQELGPKWYIINKNSKTELGSYNNFEEATEAIDDKGDAFTTKDLVAVEGYELFEEEWWRKIHGLDYAQFAKGGLVDYTGPAWVDGTPTSPEAFLSADDTRNIKALTEILHDILIPTTPTTAEKQEVKTGDTNIEIHIEVEELSSDYDVDQLVDVIQDRISEASEGQVNIVRR